MTERLPDNRQDIKFEEYASSLNNDIKALMEFDLKDPHLLGLSFLISEVDNTFKEYSKIIYPQRLNWSIDCNISVVPRSGKTLLIGETYEAQTGCFCYSALAHISNNEQFHGQRLCWSFHRQSFTVESFDDKTGNPHWLVLSHSKDEETGNELPDFLITKCKDIK